MDAVDSVRLQDASGIVAITRRFDGLHEVSVRTAPDAPAHGSCVTGYPVELITAIFERFGSSWLCDEIGRDLDENDAQLDVRLCAQAYVPPPAFSGPARILDYGCGAGSSILALARLFPQASIVAADLNPRLLEIARQRIRHYGLERASVMQCSASGEVDAGQCDYVFLNAVYEHLLPEERAPVIRNLMGALKPGGTLLLNQTPHRYFPIEAHTTGLPLINYLPDRAAQWLVERRRGTTESWPALLRAGIRGTTVSEVMRHVRAADPGAELLGTIGVSSSWPGIWYVAKRQRTRGGLSRALLGGLAAVTGTLRLPFSPYVNMAVRASNTKV
jgi:SAM-dependent methyltransferase